MILLSRLIVPCICIRWGQPAPGCVWVKPADLQRPRAEVEGALQRVQPVEQVLCAIQHRRSRLRAGEICRISCGDTCERERRARHAAEGSAVLFFCLGVLRVISDTPSTHKLHTTPATALAANQKAGVKRPPPPPLPSFIKAEKDLAFGGDRRSPADVRLHRRRQRRSAGDGPAGWRGCGRLRL